MKRFAVCLSLLLLAFFLLSISTYANKPNRVKINGAMVDLENGKIFIYGLNFGEHPEVWLDDFPLTVVGSTDEYIEASLATDVDPGTYRLKVARDGFPASHPEKADSIDVTISAFEEIDPVFVAWDKSTGISISES